MTLMVRDEADIITPMIEHHLNQGVDIIIVTDNGSVDGTTEILEEFARGGLLELRHDPVHRKQQGVVVSEMAREASRRFDADWVFNADADEFWMPVSPHLTLHQAFSQIDRGIQSFTVEVVDMTGPPALTGTGFQRLVYRDLRSTEKLNAIGLHAHSTSDAAHIGDPDVTVVQGNHAVSLESRGGPPSDLAIEVLHFPWRSWVQFSRKVDNAGSSYLKSPDLNPSANHHGMRDYGRLQDDTLYPSYLYRHPSADALANGLLSGDFLLDRRLADTLHSPVPDHLPEPNQRDWTLGKAFAALEFKIVGLERVNCEKSQQIDEKSREIDEKSHQIDEKSHQIDEKSREIDDLAAQHLAVQTELAAEKEGSLREREVLEAMQHRKIVRATDKISEHVKRFGSRKPG
ncbi:glycosyltransferase [Cryobacterium glaciale]|uniref:Glycosyltransferase n=2 Tax=Cryobacterium glaciale TaxID=1259145 RepID=A0A4R8UYK3_9MICO|nr:glycosyltransferase [Cryobacterium glaciale]